jgi:putative CocE/NonD family hydrolase
VQTGPRRWTTGVTAVLALAWGSLAAQGLPYVTEHYTKREVMVPMRDGTRLFTIIYAPRDTSRAYPFLLERTPYSVAPYGKGEFRGDLGPSALFGKEGFIFVYQDVRGRMMSEGTFVDLTPALPAHGLPTQVDESTDTYDTVAWLLKEVPNHNGRAGQWGISYPAFYAAAGLIDAHPAMKAVSPQAPIMDWFAGDDFHRNGALWLPHLFNFIASFGQVRTGPTAAWPAPLQHGTSDGYAFFQRLGPLANADARYFKGTIPFWDAVMKHGTYDAYWQARDLRPHLRNIGPAVLSVGGWFDAENLYGSLQLNRTLDTQTPATPHHLVMGPWSHGGWGRTPGDRLGDVRFGASTSEFYQTTIEFPFFMRHLKDAPDPGLPKAYAFETGSNRWRRFEAWPPPGVRPTALYFETGTRLGFTGPGEAATESYVSDPARPVPFYNGVNIGMPADYMTADQRFAGRRPDVLTFQTEVLAEDLTLAGAIQAQLWVSTTGTDADWVVKVIDVYPDAFPDPDPKPALRHQRPVNTMGGYQQLLRGEVMRGKFRDSLEHPQPFTPGVPALVSWTLNDVCHTFQKGHRIMVQVQSSWFPLMDRNPQVFTDIYSAKAEDFRKAEQRLHLGGGQASRLVLPVLR